MATVSSWCFNVLTAASYSNSGALRLVTMVCERTRETPNNKMKVDNKQQQHQPERPLKMASSRQPWFDSSIKKKDETEELLVFGYSCKLFRDDEKALYIDQGKHLIPWMGDETLKIDRYDVRGTVYDLRPLEPLPGGATEALWSSLSDAERRVEQLCDEERYRALHHNEAEEALYQEEELKRLHKALDPQNSYGQVAYSYDNEGGGESTDEKPNLEANDQTEEDDEPFVAPAELDIPVGMVLPERTKLNAIMEKTALFISTQGPQMEILLKMKQSNNPQFSFLSFDCPLHAYYRHLLMAIKTGRYRPNQPKQEEPKEQQEAENAEHYLHPSLAAAASRVDLAPSIPSIPSISYKPSADCAYSMLVNKIKDKQLKSSDGNSDPSSPQPSGIHSLHTSSGGSTRRGRRSGRIESKESHASSGSGSRTARSDSGSSRSSSSSSTDSSPNRNPTGRNSGVKTNVLVPPGEMQLIIDKMASYVMKNGRDFESVVRSKGDERFAFLDEGHKFHPYYEHKMRVYQGLEAPLSALSVAQQKRSASKKKKKIIKSPEKKKRPILLPGYEYSDDSSESEDNSQNGDSGLKPKLAPVCFSIKKPKEAEILKEVRSALPLEEESSEDDDDSQNNTDSNNSTKMASTIAATAKRLGGNTEEEMERLKQMLKEKERQLKEQEKQQRLAEKRSQDIFQIDEKIKAPMPEENVRVQVCEDKISEEKITEVHPPEEKHNIVQNVEEKIHNILEPEEKHNKVQPLEEEKKAPPTEEKHEKVQLSEEKCEEVQHPEEKKKIIHSHEENHMELQPLEEHIQKASPAEEFMTAIPIPLNEEGMKEEKEQDSGQVDSENSVKTGKEFEGERSEGMSLQVLKKDHRKQIEDEVITEAEIIDLTDEQDDAPKVTDCKLRLERKRKAAAFLNRIKKEHPLSKNGRRGSDSEVSSKYSSPSPPPAFQSKSEAISNYNGASIPRTSLMARLTASSGLHRPPGTIYENKKRINKTRFHAEPESSNKNSKDRDRSRNSASRHRRKKKKHDSSPERDHSRSRSRSVSHSRSPAHRHRVGEDSDQERHCHKHRKDDRRRSDHRRKHEIMDDDECVSGYSRHHKRHKEVRHSHFHGHNKRLRDSRVAVSDSNSSD